MLKKQDRNLMATLAAGVTDSPGLADDFFRGAPAGPPVGAIRFAGLPVAQAAAAATKANPVVINTSGNAHVKNRNACPCTCPPNQYVSNL